MLAKHIRGKRVKGREMNSVATIRDHRVYANPHLIGSLVRECHGENLLRTNVAILDQVRNAIRDDAGLAAARAGKNEHGPFGSFNGFELLRSRWRRVRWRRGLRG